MEHEAADGSADRFGERYTDLRPVGRGTSATVHRAYSPHFARDVALKVFLGGVLDEDVRRRFNRECQVLGTLADHPHVVSVFDSGFTSDGEPYIVMAYCAGGSFGQRLAGQGPRPAEEVAVVGIAVADALAAAHERGIVHRDVKPQNVLLTGYGVVALADFGVASGPLADLRSFAATPGYVAPEVVAGPDRGGPAADVYALGATLYALLTGGPPHRPRLEEAELAYLLRAANEPVPVLPATVPPALAGVVHACLRIDPAERPADAATVRRLLRLAAAEDRLELPERLDVLPVPAALSTPVTPPSAAPVDTQSGPSPWPRRLAAACVAGALLVGGIAGGARLAADGGAPGGADTTLTVPGPSGIVTLTAPPPDGSGGTGEPVVRTGGAAGRPGIGVPVPGTVTATTSPEADGEDGEDGTPGTVGPSAPATTPGETATTDPEPEPEPEASRTKKPKPTKPPRPTNPGQGGG
jgi:tRNA A-37 threonylcarbamoyl transferase component Bud32